MKRRRKRFSASRLKKMLDKKFIPVYLGVLAVIFIFVFVLSAGRGNDISSAEQTSFSNRKTITVGVVTDNSTFAFKDDSENITGYDADVIKELLNLAYPDKKIVLKSVDSQLASYLLKTGEINLAIGQFTKGVTKTQGLAVSKGYYTDTIYAYTPESSRITDINELRSKTVLVMTTEIPRTTAKKALDEIVSDTKILSCSSYSDAKDSLKQGRCAAIVAPKQQIALRQSELKSLPTAITTVDYCILAWADNSSVITYLNTYISQMKEDGTLKNIEEKYSLYTPSS